MRYSKYFIPTYKEDPSEAEVISHKLMLRAGMIRKITTGVYAYLPLGLRSIRKVENIVREEMNRAGAIELLMPLFQPAELWKESGRWDLYGKELLRFKDRYGRDACLGPTHEEVITAIVRNEIHSYKQLPITLYQIHVKFRDEIRPRFGIMRCREFIMKDAYSFDADDKGAEKSYEIMKEAYNRIFRRCGFRFTMVEADTGAIGGSYSHEFMVLADTGEDQIVSCERCGYSANLEKAEVSNLEEYEDEEELPMEEVDTPGMKSIEEVSRFLNVSPKRLVKTLICLVDGKPVAALIRGDHELNEIKLRNLFGASEIELADERTVQDITGAPVGFAGPVGLDIKIVADSSIKGMKNFVTGANKKDKHLINVNIGRDFDVDIFADIRFARPGDRCPRCGSELIFKRGIEVGHIFKLGTKYSKAMNATFTDKDGKEKPFVMGCYGIGIGRCVAAAIEQYHDENGIIFPISISPFEVIVLPVQMNDQEVVQEAEKIYHKLLEAGIDVLIDDRNERAGVKFNDADLIGIPVRITVGKKALRQGMVEMKLRSEKESHMIPLDSAVKRTVEKVRELYDSLK